MDEISVVRGQIAYRLQTPTPASAVPDKSIVQRDASNVVDRSGNYVVTRV